MRIVLVHTDLRMYWPPRLLALDRALRKRGDEFFVVEIAGNGSPYDFASRDYTDRELDWSILLPGGDLRCMSGRMMARAVEQKLNELQPDMVMAGGIAFPSGAAAVRWARRNRRGVVIFDNVRTKDVPRSWIVEFVKRRIYANVDGMLIPAESHVPSYVQWGIPREQMFFGLNVVDNQWFGVLADRLRMKSTSFGREHSLPDNFFLGVGRQVPKKNWLACLKAYQSYRAMNKSNPWGLVLIGDGSERAFLKELVQHEEIPDVVFPGFVQGEDLVAYYAAAGAFVLPSLHGETWGLVVNEAMACGLPVLVSSRCGCAETLVRDGVNGWKFSPDRASELAVRMQQISDLPEAERLKMAAASRHIISSWGIDRFIEGAEAAIDVCRQVNRGYASLLDRILINLWNGRFRPT